MTISIDEPIPITFRPLVESDMDAVLLIEVEAYPEPWTPVMFSDELRNRLSHFYVAYGGETLVAYGGYWLVVDEAHITSVTVQDLCRGKGLGRQLLGYLLQSAIDHGATLATLEVRESNEHAKHLYLSSGFSLRGRRKCYYPHSREDALVMVKRLV